MVKSRDYKLDKEVSILNSSARVDRRGEVAYCNYVLQNIIVCWLEHTCVTYLRDWFVTDLTLVSNNDTPIKEEVNSLVSLPSGELMTPDGEILDFVPRKKDRDRGPTWFKAIKPGFKMLANMPITFADRRLLDMMMGHIKYGSRVIVNQTHYANLLGANQATISKSLKQLESLSIISQCERIGVIRVYKICPAYCWTGPDKRKKSDKQFPIDITKIDK